jgi:hypothetical protein
MGRVPSGVLGRVRGGGAVVGTPCGAYERCLFGRASLIGETFE